MEWYQFLLQLMVGLGSAWLYSYFKKDAQNTSDKEFAKSIAELQEQGKNTATKADIEEITEKIETVKNEISFEKQREHEFIKERTEHLLNYYQYIEEVNCLGGLLLFYLYDETAKDRLVDLQDKLGRNLSNIWHETRMINITIKDKDIESKIYEISNKVQEYSIALSTITSNAISHLSRYELCLKYNLSKDAVDARDLFYALQNQHSEVKKKEWEEAYNGLIKLLSIISKLYEQKFHVKLNYKSEG